MVDDVLQKNFKIDLSNNIKIKYNFKLGYNISKFNFSMYLLNDKIYSDEKFQYMRYILL